MRACYLLSFAFAFMLCCHINTNTSEKTNEVNIPDSSTNHETRTEGKANPAEYSCANLFIYWGIFAKKNRYCENDDDCIIIGTEDCRCAGFLKGFISKSAKADALLYLSRYHSKDCEKLREKRCGFTDSITDRESLRCDNGKCTADLVSCTPTTP